MPTTRQNLTANATPEKIANTIRIWRRVAAGWLAEINHDGNYIVAPTPFTMAATLDEVRARLERCNPGSTVIHAIDRECVNN